MQNHRRDGSAEGREDPARLRKRNIENAGLHASDVLPSDLSVSEDVCNAILGADIDAPEVEVIVDRGVVTLTGTVTDATTRHHLEQLCFDVAGVQAIDSQIQVVPAPGIVASSSTELPTSHPLARSFGGSR